MRKVDQKTTNRNPSTARIAGGQAKRVPRSIATGLLFGAVECHVLDDGRRVLSKRGAVALLQGKSSGSKHGDLGRFLSRLPEKYSVSEAGPNIEFEHARGIGHGIEGGQIVDICLAYVNAASAGALRADQAHLARNAQRLVNAAAKVGVAALIDEATGHQADRAADALQGLFKRLFRDDFAPWQRTFDEEWNRAFCRLYRVKYLGLNPRFMGNINAMFFKHAFGLDAYEHLKSVEPDPRFGRNLHLLFTSDVGRPKLEAAKQVFLGLAKTCRTKDVFWHKIKAIYGSEALQFDFLDEVEGAA